MQNAPKIVTERLRAAAVSAEHPDADVLTAFSERLLPERERNSVLEHLARCGECREIVALALPNSETSAERVPRPSGGWLTWPALRWGFVAAGFVAVTSVGIVQYRRQTTRQPIAGLYDTTRADAAQPVAKEAKNLAPPVAGEPAKEAPKIQIPPASAGAVAAVSESKPAIAKKQARDLDRLEAFSQPQSRGTGGVGMGHAPATFGPSVRQQAQQNNFYANNSQQVQAPPPAYAKRQGDAELTTNAPAPVAPNANQVSAASAPVQAQNQEALTLSSKSLPLEPTDGGHREIVARAKSPDPLMANNKAPAVSPTPSEAYAYGTAGGKYAANTRWAINSTGGLQRSVDQGTTWQDVSVSGAPAAAGPSLDLAMKTSRLKAAEKDKADQDRKLNETAPVVFRAVAANGTDVWAGGSAGLLYHSTDAGGHWTRVVPFSGDTVLSGDIVSLEFFSVQYGRIVTSTGQIWTTADGGQTWQKQ